MKKVQISVRINPKIKEAIEDFCSNHDILVADWFKEAIKVYFKRTVLKKG